jgi:hypothetical protein
VYFPALSAGKYTHSCAATAWRPPARRPRDGLLRDHHATAPLLAVI